MRFTPYLPLVIALTFLSPGCVFSEMRTFRQFRKEFKTTEDPNRVVILDRRAITYSQTNIGTILAQNRETTYFDRARAIDKPEAGELLTAMDDAAKRLAAEDGSEPVPNPSRIDLISAQERSADTLYDNEGTDDLVALDSYRPIVMIGERVLLAVMMQSDTRGTTGWDRHFTFDLTRVVPSEKIAGYHYSVGEAGAYGFSVWVLPYAGGKLDTGRDAFELQFRQGYGKTPLVFAHPIRWK